MSSFSRRLSRRCVRAARLTTSITTLPLYLPQDAQARCGRRSAPHSQRVARTALRAWWLRRLAVCERFLRIRTTIGAYYSSKPQNGQERSPAVIAGLQDRSHQGQPAARRGLGTRRFSAAAMMVRAFSVSILLRSQSSSMPCSLQSSMVTSCTFGSSGATYNASATKWLINTSSSPLFQRAPDLRAPLNTLHPYHPIIKRRLSRSSCGG